MSKLTAKQRAMKGMPEPESYPGHKSYQNTTLTPQERAAYVNTEQYVSSYASAAKSHPSAHEPYTFSKPPEYSEPPYDWSSSEPSSYASAESPYKLSPLKPAESLSSPDPGAESPIQWFKNLKPYDESADASFTRTVKGQSHWKTLSTYAKLVSIIPLFKKEEKELNDALLEMQEITDLDRAMRLVKKFPADIRFVHPSIYTEEMIQIVLKEDPQRAIFIDKSNRAFIKHMMPQFLAVPNIFDYIVLDEFLTERDLYELGVRTRFSKHDITSALRGQTVLYVHALCHGGLIGPIKSPQKITRYSSIPLGVCEMLSSLKMSVIRRTTTYENFVEKNVEHIRELMQRTHYSEDNPRYRAVLQLKGVVPKKTFTRGQFIMNKTFSSLDVSDWHLNFLDIVTPYGKFNLFSLKPEWTLEEIAAMFPDKEIVLCDYSCSPNAGFTPEELASTGGTKRKRNRRKTRRRF